MPLQALTGSRVRERRLALGLRQGDVAAAAGISASYLNLIEHNRRRVAPALLQHLAAALQTEARVLGEGAGGTLLDDLRAAAAGELSAGLAGGLSAGLSVGGEAGPAAELDRLEDFAGRFPGWAGLVAAQHRRMALLERSVEALNDRMSHDPHLSAALHEVLSAVSSVRSTSAILAETEDIAPEWRARFHRNLHQDSERLAAGAEALVAYLDGSDQAEEQGIAAPQEEVEAWLARRGWHLAEVEAGGAAALAGEIAGLASGAARRLAEGLAERAAAEARALPAGPFAAARAEGADPLALAARFGVGVPSVVRRMALLPGSPVGLVICDASGTLVFRKPVAGFALPRFGAACPLWPLYTVLARPMTPLQAVVETPGRAGRRFSVLAFCEVRFPAGFGGPEVREAVMLIDPAPVGAAEGAGPVVPVGSSCRICPRGGCVARREPSILAETV